MNTDFERTRLDVCGRGVTITSWYEADKQRYRANAPAFLHVMNDSDVPEAQTVGTTRERAIHAVRNRLETCLMALETKHRP